MAVVERPPEGRGKGLLPVLLRLVVLVEGMKLKLGLGMELGWGLSLVESPKWDPVGLDPLPPREVSPAGMRPRGRSPEGPWGEESTVCLVRAERSSSMATREERGLNWLFGGTADEDRTGS